MEAVTPEQIELEIAQLLQQKAAIVADIEAAASVQVRKTLESFGIFTDRLHNVSYVQVRQFHETFGHPAPREYAVVSWDRLDQRFGYVESEVDEGWEAIANRNLPKVLDALGDALYFIEGTFVEMGINSADVIDLIHQSNMTKLWDDDEESINAHLSKIGLSRDEVDIKPLPGGKAVVYRTSDRKVMKGPNFVDVDLSVLLPGEHG